MSGRTHGWPRRNAAHSRSLWACGIGCTLVFAAICLLPVAVIFAGSVWQNGAFSVDGYRHVLSDARQWTLLRNSLVIALGTALVAGALGSACGFAIQYVGVPTRRALSWCLAVPFLMPPYISTMAWIDCLGRNGLISRSLRDAPATQAGLSGLYSLPGVIGVLALSYFPIVAFAAVTALRRFDHRLAEAGSLARRPGAVFWIIVLPCVLPSVLTGALLVFVLALTGLAVPSLLQINTYAVEVHTTCSYQDIPGATAQALPFLAAGMCAFAVWALYLRPRQAWLTGAQRPARGRGRAWARLGLAAMGWVLVAVAAGVPVAALVVRAWPLTSFVEVWRTARGEIVNSVLISAVSATLLTGLAFVMAFLARRGVWAARAAGLSLLPFLVSGPLLGIGLIRLWNRPGPASLVYDSVAIVVLACVARYFFLAQQGAAASLRDLHPRIEEAAEISGIAWWRQLTGVIFPLQRPFFVALWGLAFLLSLGELDAAVLVCPPGATTLSVRLFTLMHYGPSRYVAALSLITVLLMFGAAGLFFGAYRTARRALDAHH